MNERFCPRCFEKFGDEIDECTECNIQLVAALDRDLTGTVLDNRYEVIDRIGKGGMGVVYRAKQRIIDRIVALKVLRRELVQDEASVKRFLVEAKAVSSLRNAHIVTLYDFGITQAGLLYFTMELLDGQPLTHVIRDEAPLSPSRVASIISQASTALGEAHQKGILHRDLKPDNIFLVTDSEGNEFAKVLDFGIAKILDDGASESITQTGMVCGTPLYLSPEQAMGRPLDARSDLYSLGVIMYEMLSGEPPFVDATPIGILLKQVNEAPRSIRITNPDVSIPVALDSFLMRVLAKAADERPQDIAQFKKQLAEAVEKGEESPGETVPLGSLETRTNGVRMLADRTASAPTDLGLDETMAVPTPQALMFAADTGNLEQVATEVSNTRDELEALQPGKETTALARQASGKKSALWGAAVVGALVIAVALAFASGFGRGTEGDSAEEEAGLQAAEQADSPIDEEAVARQKALEEANKKADKEARAEVRKEQEEFKVRQEAELKRMEVERKKLEQMRLTAEEEAKRKADEEARQKAEKEAAAKAQRKAEEAEKKAAAEARKKAEEEAEKKAADGSKEKTALEQKKEQARKLAAARKKEEARKKALEKKRKEEARKKALEKKRKEEKKKDDELDFENI
jgi:hypothetical protein